MNKQYLIQHLSLEPHTIEGGYFRRTYTSEIQLNNNETRASLSSIFYMLTNESPIGYLHINQSDILHYFHHGAPITYYIVHPSGH